MKYIKLRIWLLVASVILLGVGYLLSGETDFTLCDSIYTKCGHDLIFGFGKPFYFIMVGVTVSMGLSFLMLSNKIFKIWGIISLILLFIISLEVINSPVICGTLICSKSEVAPFYAYFFTLMTGFFVVISLVYSLVLYINSKKVKSSS